jgi:hypothetical protein
MKNMIKIILQSKVQIIKMEYVPYDVLKETSFYLSVPQIMKMCQSQIYLHNLFEEDDFWLKYLDVNYKNIPVNVLKYVRNSHAGYKQIAMKMYDGQAFSLHDGTLIPVFGVGGVMLGYTILDLNNTLTDFFLQIEREIVDLDIETCLNGENWTIYVTKMYKSSKTPPSGHHLRYRPDPDYSLIVMKVHVLMKNDGSRHIVETDVPINTVQVVDVGAITSITIRN